MPGSATMTFDDPYDYQASVRAADVQVFVTGPGLYRSALTRIDFHQLWMQRSRTSLPQVGTSALRNDRTVVCFLAGDEQAPVRYSGKEVSPADIIFNALGGESHQHMPAPCHWGSMSLRPEDLAAAGRVLAGTDLRAPASTHLIRPPPDLVARLRNLHEAAGHLALTAPDILAHPEVAKAVEQELVRAMVACLTAGMELKIVRPAGGRVPVMQRFERLLEASQGEPLYLAEVCAEIGVTDRTLRMHCQDHLGMSPHRYLWLRRMHLARRALVLANPTVANVTEIATDKGFGELGRFAVAYRKLFGESPSVTLHRPPDARSTAQKSRN